MQYDSDGNLIGVLKRCYAFVQNGQWHLVPGFKVGNLITEWIGQAQFAPQLIGFIEGAPPAPSENLTSTGTVLGKFGDYNDATSVEIRVRLKPPAKCPCRATLHWGGEFMLSTILTPLGAWQSSEYAD